VLSVIVVLLAMVSFGPQKWIDPAIGQIWPAVLLGELAACVLIVQALLRFRSSAV